MQQKYNLLEFVQKCRHHWKWFVLSVVLIPGITLLYLMSKESQYERTAQILIKEESKGGLLGKGLSDFADLGLFGGSSNLKNELLTLRSNPVVLEALRRIGADISYSKQMGLKEVTLYGKNQPVSVSIEGLDDADHIEMDIAFAKDGKFTLKKMRRNKTKFSEPVSGKLNVPVKTPVGMVTVMPTENYVDQADSTISVLREDRYLLAEEIGKRLGADFSDEDATIIDLSFKDPSIERANAFLLTLIEVYKEQWLADKDRISRHTTDFITERLGVLEKELGEVAEDISEYKTRNHFIDIIETAKMNMKEATQAEALLLQVNNELQMAKYIRDYVKNNSQSNQLLPVNMLSQNKVVEEQIALYNTELLKRNRTAESSSADNPVVAEMDTRLNAMRHAIEASLNNTINQLQIQANGMQGSIRKSQAQMDEAPGQVKDLLSAERRQAVTQAIYVFLLEKREENQVQQALTSENTQIISAPMGSTKPVAPKKMRLLFLAIVLSCLLPAAIIYLLDRFDTKIRSKKDLEHLQTPYLGRIPKVKKCSKSTIAVDESASEALGKAIEKVEQGLDFMMSEGGSHVLQTTGLYASGGKSFVAYHLANAYANRQLRVVLVDFDFSNQALSRAANHHGDGVSKYLAGKTDDWASMLTHVEGNKQIDLLPAGVMPPNAMELLGNGRAEALVAALRREYDVIVIDSKPIVTPQDALYAAKFSDITMLVLRYGESKKTMLPVIEQFYAEKILPHPAVIINATPFKYYRGLRY